MDRVDPPEGGVNNSEAAGRATGRLHRGADVGTSVTDIIHDMELVREDLPALFDGKHARKIGMATEGYEVRHVATMDDAAALTDDWADEAQSLYVSVNPIDPKALTEGKSESKDVPRRTALFFDFDVQAAHEHGRPATSEENSNLRKCALQVGEMLGSAKPFRFGPTGRGYYALYRIDLPNDPEAYRLIANVLAAVAARVEARYPGIKVDQSCKDAIRVRRISGTVNRRCDPPVLCRLVCNDDAPIIPRETLEGIAALAPRSSTESTEAGQREAGTIELTEDEMGVLEDAWNLFRKPGNRHDTGLWIPAFLAHKGISRDSARKVFRRIVGNDNDVEDRMKGFERTYDRFKRGEEVKWKEDLPFTVVERLNAVARIIRDRVEGKADDDDTEESSAVPASNDGAEKEPRRNTADRITDHVLAHAEVLSCDNTGAAHISVKVDGHIEHHRVGSTTFESMVSILWVAHSGSGAKRADLDQVATNIAARAIASGVRREPSYRIAHADGEIFVDPVWPDWSVFKVTAEGWKIVPSHEIRIMFLRSPKIHPLPNPERDGTLDSLFELYPLDETGRMFVTAFLMSAFQDGGTKPVLGLVGGPGSGKTTLAEMLISILSPTVAPIRSMPDSDENWALAGAHTLMFGIDNVTFLTRKHREGLARVTTGFDSTGRAMHSNDQERNIHGHAAVVITSIPPVLSVQEDVADRALSVEVPGGRPIRRMKQVIRQVDAERPKWIGCLLDAAACYLRNEEETDARLGDALPRLADLAVIMESTAEHLGFEPGAFVEAVRSKRSEAYLDALENYPVFQLITDRLLTYDNGYRWEGTASDLLEAINDKAGDSLRRSGRMPAAPNVLSSQLSEIVSAARLRGYSIEMKRTRKGRVIAIGRVQDEGRHALGGEDSSPQAAAENVRPYRPKEPVPTGHNCIECGAPFADGTGYCPDHSGLSVAKSWLFDRLKRGSQPVDAVSREAKEHDITPDHLRDARAALRIVTHSISGRNYWRLPAADEGEASA